MAQAGLCQPHACLCHGLPRKKALSVPSPIPGLQLAAPLFNNYKNVAYLLPKIALHRRQRRSHHTQHPMHVALNSHQENPALSASEAHGHPEPRGINKFFWKSAISKRINVELAVEEACRACLRDYPAGLPGPTLALIFLSSAYSDEYSCVLRELRAQVPSLELVVGCSGYGVIGQGGDGQPEEIESAPACSITLAYLPGVTTRVTHVTHVSLPDEDAPPGRWAQLLGIPLPAAGGATATTPPCASGSAGSGSSSGADATYSGSVNASRADGTNSLSFLVLSDPSFALIYELLAGLDYAYPGTPKIGGLASAGTLSHSRGLWCWDGRAEAAAAAAAATTVQGLHGPVLPADPLEAPSQTLQPHASHSPAVAAVAADQASGYLLPASATAPAARTGTSLTGLQHSGAVVLSFQGPMVMELMVSQGCRPLSGTTWSVERLAHGSSSRIAALREEATGQVLPALEALQRELQGPPPGAAGSAAGGAADLRGGHLCVGIAPIDVLPGGATTSFPSSSPSASTPASSPEPPSLQPPPPTSPLPRPTPPTPPATQPPKQPPTPPSPRPSHPSSSSSLQPPSSSLQPSELLVRNVALNDLGQVVVLGDGVRVGQRLRFLVRGKEFAIEDLRERGLAVKRRQLQASLEGHPLPPAFGLLVFSCSGRGSSLYGQPHVDSRTLSAFISVPASGFLCSGEIGSLGATTHLHGFTCAAAVLRATQPEQHAPSTSFG